MKRIAILLTVFNRKEKTLTCLDSLYSTYVDSQIDLPFDVYLTDDGSTDGSADAILERNYPFNITLLKGTGSLYWNGGMISSWNAAIEHGGYDGYLWLNNDTLVLPAFWQNLIEADEYCHKKYGSGGIYVGSTRDAVTGKFTYGGFDFVNKLTLKDKMIMPDGKSFQECQCAHGNITFVSSNVVSQMGIFYDGYIHGAGDHDYTYRAWKYGFPVLVMKDYVGECENDHPVTGGHRFYGMNLKQRIAYMKSPFGFNLHNTLLFQKRCFPYRYPIVFVASWLKCLFPDTISKIRRTLRK